jgi:hypothetical protein
VSDEFHGLIQHSFALRVPSELRPIYTRKGVAEPERLLRTIFDAGEFTLGTAEMDVVDLAVGLSPDDRGVGRLDGAWRYSLLAKHGLTNVAPLRFPFAEAGEEDELAALGRGPLSWAWDGSGSACAKPWEGFVFSGQDRRPYKLRNDFLIQGPESTNLDGPRISRFLTQFLAHKRSHLFGLALGRSTFNVLAPYALLHREGESWLAQPMISLFQLYARRAFRPTFSFSMFLLPVETDGTPSSLSARKMGVEEIPKVVKGQWSLATAHDDPTRRQTFTVKGPFVRYLDQAAGPSLTTLGLKLDKRELTGEHSLREFTEAALFSLATLMTGKSGTALKDRAQKLLGDRIVTSLSASRVSSVAVVDPAVPGRQVATLNALATKIATPLLSNYAAVHKYRLDETLFDRVGYASAVLPEDRCVITVGSEAVQEGLKTSLLTEAGWTAFQVIAAATATGLIRSIFREITISERAGPDRIADIEGEAMVELHETYDIEITVESYRRHYCSLRKHLWIDKEYEDLSDKLQALHRETSTRSEGRSERRLAILTWAIVVLSALILVGTLALIFKPGG